MFPAPLLQINVCFVLGLSKFAEAGLDEGLMPPDSVIEERIA
jgi:hypothetical protein